MVNVKKKGNHGENEFANWLLDNGIKGFRNSASGANAWKGDIGNNLDLTIEVKTVKKLNLQECWRQVERDSSLARTSPLLAVHFDKMPKREWLIVLHSEDWLDMIKKYKNL
jgi:Holliday junction resolvase